MLSRGLPYLVRPVHIGIFDIACQRRRETLTLQAESGRHEKLNGRFLFPNHNIPWQDSAHAATAFGRVILSPMLRT